MEPDTVCVCFTAQSQLPRGETALRVPAQQVGPHQAANSGFWRAQSQGLVLTARHTSSQISIESACRTRRGGGVSDRLLFKTPSVTASRTVLPPHHQPLFLPFSLPHHALSHSFLFLLIFDSTGFIIACSLEILCGLYPTSTPTSCFHCLFFFFFPQWAPVEFHTTGLVEGAACMCEGVWGLQLF